VDPANAHLAELGTLWRWFEGTIAPGYSPLYSAIATAVADDREVLGLVQATPPDAHHPPALLAAVHYLLLGGLDHPLGAVYGGESDADPAPLFRDLCLSHRDELVELLAFRRVQTNEVGRSSLIGPGLLWAAGRYGAPLQLVDVGCSAGLNLLCDEYLLDYGPYGRTGSTEAEVRIECEVVGGPPPVAPRLPDVAGRTGIDRNPPDLADPDDARWLLACVWPDTGRLERSATAIRRAAGRQPAIHAGDAVALLPGVLAGLGPGLVVVVTTWAYAYLLPEQRPAFVDALRATGRHRPVVWVAAEGRGVVEAMDASGMPGPPDAPECDVLSAWSFDGGTEEIVALALVHSHGQWLDWRA